MRLPSIENLLINKIGSLQHSEESGSFWGAGRRGLLLKNKGVVLKISLGSHPCCPSIGSVRGKVSPSLCFGLQNSRICEGIALFPFVSVNRAESTLQNVRILLKRTMWEPNRQRDCRASLLDSKMAPPASLLFFTLSAHH